MPRRVKRDTFTKADGGICSMPQNGYAYWVCDCGELNPDNKHKCGCCGGQRPEDIEPPLLAHKSVLRK